MKYLLFVATACVFLPAGMSPSIAASERRILVTDFSLARGVEKVFTGEETADWLAESLGLWKNVEIISRDQFVKEMAVRDLAAPLDKDQVLLIARSLEAEVYVTGQINRVKIWSKGEKARVEVQVEMVDVLAEAPINGAVVEAELSTAAATGLPAPMSALRFAVQQAVNEMRSRNLPSGKVLTVDSFGGVIIDLGSRSGVKKGMRFVVTRREFDAAEQRHFTSRIGEIRVTDVDMSDATAVPAAGTQSIKALDKIRSIYNVKTAKISRYRK